MRTEDGQESSHPIPSEMPSPAPPADPKAAPPASRERTRWLTTSLLGFDLASFLFVTGVSVGIFGFATSRLHILLARSVGWFARGAQERWRV